MSKASTPVLASIIPFEIEKLETSFQMGEDQKLGYNATEKYLYNNYINEIKITRLSWVFCLVLSELDDKVDGMMMMWSWITILFVTLYVEWKYSSNLLEHFVKEMLFAYTLE